MQILDFLAREVIKQKTVNAVPLANRLYRNGNRQMQSISQIMKKGKNK